MIEKIEIVIHSLDMNFIVIILFVFTTFFSLSQASADGKANVNRTGQVYTSDKAGATATLKFEKGNAGEVIISARKRKYIIPLDSFHLLNGDLWISEDGETVVWILKNYFLSHKVKSDSEALLIFQKGKLARKVLLNEFIKDFKKLNQTVSHTQWLLKQNCLFDKNHIELVTVEDRHFNIDIISGAVSISKK